MKRLRWIGAGALALAMGVPATASAATISVDDDGLDCPSAPYTSVQAAVDAASPGDVIAICPGTYEEGPATVPAGGANAVSIAKMLTHPRRRREQGHDQAQAGARRLCWVQQQITATTSAR